MMNFVLVFSWRCRDLLLWTVSAVRGYNATPFLLPFLVEVNPIRSFQPETYNIKYCTINANNEERTKSQFFLLFFPFFFSSQPPKEFPPLLEGSSPPLVELSLSESHFV